jgi:hypothetical protein
MKYVVVTHSQFDLDKPTETFLLSALDGLQRECDSILNCRVHLQGVDSTSGKPKPFCVTLLLSTGEHHINVRAFEPTNNALTARDAIRAAIDQATLDLRDLKVPSNCVAALTQRRRRHASHVT